MKKYLIALVALVLCSISISAQPRGRGVPMTEEQKASGYTKREVMIPMRDGVKLFTAIYEPADSCGPRPIIMVRTPYSCSPYGEGNFNRGLRGGNRYFDNRYIFVFQDVRGTNHSEGTFVNARPYNTEAVHGAVTGNSTEIDEATDSYDTIEWLVNNTRSNHCVGVKGVSYPGFYATLAALSNHPALKAASPQAPVTDWFLGDDVHHNGAFMMKDIFSFGSFFFLDREANANEPYRSHARIEGNAYDYFLKLGSTKAMFDAIADEKTLRDKYNMWEDIIDNPNYNAYWKSLNPCFHFNDVKPAMMVVGGSYDGEDCWGAVHTYRELKARSPKTETYFVYGPWMHGGWDGRGANSIVNYHFGNSIDTWYYDDCEYAFFRHYLEGKGPKPAAVSIMPSFWDNDADIKPMTGECWPPEGRSSLNWYLGENGTLSNEAPKARGKSFDSYVSDPDNPVPFTKSEWMNAPKYYVVEDQSFLEGRNDVLSYRSASVSDTLFLCGPLQADIWVSSSSEDLDLVVKLIDVAPDGRQMMVKSDLFRCRYRKGFETPVFMKKNKPEEISFELTDVAHYVLPGHSLMVQVQSSWFPLVDMNPQSPVENIYRADKSSFKKAEVKIWHDRRHPSRLLTWCL